MDKKARISNWFIAISMLIAVTSFMYFVFAAHVVATFNLQAGYNFSVNEDRGYIYNISVNSTESQNNITEVNITLPAGFILRDPEIWAGAVNLSYINGTPATAYTFRNTTTNLSFSGNNLIIGNSSGVTAMFFWFNASVATPGEYNLTVTTVNITGAVTNTTLIRVTVNDTTPPQVTIVRPQSKNYSVTSIEFNITVTDNTNVSNCTYTLRHGIATAANYSMSGNASMTAFNGTNASIVEGAYNVSFYCNDTSSNWNNTEIIYFGIDTTIPNVSIINPTNITYTTTNTSIRFNISVTESATSCQYTLNGGLNNVSMSSNSTANTGFNATNTSIADGGYVVNFYCNDTADNWNRTSTVTFSKDVTPPLVTVISPLAKNYSATSIEFNVSTNENSTCLYSIDGGANNVTMTRNATDTGFNVTNSSIVNGVYNVSFYCNDTNGNWNRSVVRGFGMDTAVLGIGIVSPTNITYTVSNSSIRFNVSTTEAATSCWYSLNSGLFNYSMSSNDTTINRGWNATNTSIADGGYNVSFYCNDSADNWNRTVSRMFSIERGNPGVTIIAPAVARNYSVTSIEFNVSTTENATCLYSLDSGLNNVTMTANSTNRGFNHTNNSIANGAYTANFYCNDTTGNQNNTESRVFGTDTAIPGIGIVNPANITYTAGNTSIRFNVSTTEAATSCSYSLNSGLNNVSMSSNDTTVNRGWNATNTSIADGGYNVSFYCNDSADNWNRTVSRMFSIDTTIPLVTIISPIVKNYSATSIEFNVSINENATCLYSLDGGANNVTMTRNATDTGFNYTNASIANGAYNVSFYCNDTNGNWNRSLIRGFGMDNVVPGVSIVVNPANITYTAGNTSIRFNVSTTEAATSCSYSLNSGLNNVSMSSNDTTVNRGWNATNTSIADGGYNVSFYCNDSADNWNRTVSRMFSIDRTAPGITILSPSVSRNYSATSILFNLSTGENATCFYSLDSGLNNVSMQRNATDTGYNQTNNSIVNGAYTVNFYCNDTNGNWNRSMSRAFITDTVAPALTFSCTPATVSQSNAVTCSCSATDATSGINVSYAVNGLSFTANPSTASSGTQTTTCSSVDYAGNTVSLSTTYTVEVSGGGGGGGGGGGTTSATVTRTVDSESKVVAIIVEATPITVTITKSASLGVSEIVIESTEKIENVKVSVDKLSGQPATVSTAPTGGSSGVYSYLKIEAPQASGKIKDADITFDVKKSWINEKGINVKDVVLQRYTTKWDNLPTVLLSENAEKATYKATTPGFSFFAVTAKSNVTTTTATTNVTEEAAATTEEEGAAEGANLTWLWIAIAVIIVVIIIAIAAKKGGKGRR